MPIVLLYPQAWISKYICRLITNAVRCDSTVFRNKVHAVSGTDIFATITTKAKVSTVTPRPIECIKLIVSFSFKAITDSIQISRLLDDQSCCQITKDDKKNYKNIIEILYWLSPLD